MAETIPGGRYINADGYWVNAHGQYIDEDGHLVDEPVQANAPKAKAASKPTEPEKK